MKKRKKDKFEIELISYVHDPEAAQKWFEIYIEILKKEIKRQTCEKLD